MQLETARRTARTAGLITAPTGVALLAAPRLAGITGLTPGAARAIGAADLAIAAGLLAGRPSWPWAAARAAANVATAVVVARTGTPSGRALAGALAVLTCLDGAAARSLHAAGR
jgi:hypothetical protein